MGAQAGTCARVGMNFTADQNNAIEAILAWHASAGKQQFAFGGYAGTGKTTVIKEILKRLPHGDLVAVAAFTGKAVSVLRGKGIQTAQTLHSLMYESEWDEEKKTFYFRRRPALGAIPLIVVDEASMLSTQLYSDILSYDLPVLFVGDPGQLEPIGENPNVMRDQDWTLQEIHRQAENSPIVKLSVQARRGDSFRSWRGGGPVTLGDYRHFCDAVFEVDQAICGYNKTRVSVNEMVREAKGYSGTLCVGERIICLLNNRKQNVFNGMQATVKAIRDQTPSKLEVDIEVDDGSPRKGIFISATQFGKERFSYEQHANSKTGKLPDPSLTFWDYAYCVTCHKAQGSEADSVAVLEQLHESWDTRRWTYTAITRAREKLVYCR